MSKLIMRLKSLSGTKRDILIITLIYVASQSILLIVTGRWWDDWVFYNQTQEDLIKIASETGRISFFVVIKFAKLFPENGYRIIVYLMYYFGALFFYATLKQALKINNKACCTICSLYVIIPVNDARIMLCVFPYAIGIFFFLAGFYLLTFIVNSDCKKVWRVVDLILFWLSYTLNADLVLYAIVLLYILVYEKTLKNFIKYIDYLFLPIVFYFGKKMFFTPYGGYEGYNEVTIERLLKGIVNILPADIFAIMRVVYKLMLYGAIPAIIVCILFFIANWRKIWKIIISIYQGKSEDLVENENIGTSDIVTIKQLVILLIVGSIILSAGLFSYVVVRESYTIYITGLEGRDAMLVSLGASIIIFTLCEFVLNKRIKIYGYSLIVMCGVVHFNVWYLAYQSDYYRQLGFQYQLTLHEELSDSKNIVYLSNDAGKLSSTVFYVLNANGEMAYGNQTRLIMGGFDNIHLLYDDNLDYFVESGNYHMRDYDITYKKIDAIIEYSNPISAADTLKLKFYEIFNYEKFENWIKENSDLYVILAGTDEYNQRLGNTDYINVGKKQNVLGKRKEY